MSTPLMLPSLLGLGLGGDGPTNIVIFQRSGTEKRPLYWNGRASSTGLYPVSLVYHGMAVNITVHQLRGQPRLSASLPAERRCRVSQRIIDFLEDGPRGARNAPPSVEKRDRARQSQDGAATFTSQTWFSKLRPVATSRQPFRFGG